MDNGRRVLEALASAPRWHVVHWGTRDTSTLLCLWVAGRESLVHVDAAHVTYRGVQEPLADGRLGHVLRGIQGEQDEAALITPLALRTRTQLLQRWSQLPEDGRVGVWHFPRGGHVRWLRGDALRIEASEGGAHHLPMPAGLLEVLVDLGWNPPDARHRDCWVQPAPHELETAARLCVLTPLAAFGYDLPPPIDGA